MDRNLPGSSFGSEHSHDLPQRRATPATSVTYEHHDASITEEFPRLTNGQPAPLEEKKEIVDAGLKSLDHCMLRDCNARPRFPTPSTALHVLVLLVMTAWRGVRDKRAMPSWRYHLRQRALPLVRWETPYLAYFQNVVRTPALDSYFAITANLGTHTFFMIGLPILFWCGWPAFGKGLVHILAVGVFFSGFIKDMLSLPRPLSPPLHRITMSGSVALEYGFPSTHSANAVSVALYAVLLLRSPDCSFAPTTRFFLESLGYFYAASIIIGRLYCGMHGFADIVFGSILGAIISLLEFYYGPMFEAYIQSSGWMAPLIVALVITLLVRVHPEPVDDCPCFDDSVAFSGVMIGLEVASWHAGSKSLSGPFPGLTWQITIMRIVTGVLCIVAWRESMKPMLLTFLPQLFRIIERLGVSLPRRFFVPASEYKNIPNLLKLRTDNVLPTIRDLPQLVKTLRGPARGRSVSIGPQSAADAYEALAYRERKRRESIGSNGSLTSVNIVKSHTDLRERFQADGAAHAAMEGGDVPVSRPAPAGMSTALAEYEHQLGQARVLVTRSKKGRTPSPATPITHTESKEDETFARPVDQDELGERDIFEQLVKPRVRYDVEVLTKLIVYTGIAWLAVEGIPSLHEYVGLGVRHLQVVKNR